MSKKHKKRLIRLIASAALLAAACLIPSDGWVKALIFAVPYLFIGCDVLLSAARNILRGQVFDEKFLMSIASVGAFATGEYAEAVFVMLLFQVGELFESIAVGKSRQSISRLMDIRPDSAFVERDGKLTEVDPDEVSIGETIVVSPGQKIPIDGVVTEGESSLNTVALTGEAMPRDVGVGGSVISGCVNLSGVLRIRTTKAFGESTVSRILELVENSTESKSRSENFITEFARWYTPAVVAAAVLLAIVPSLITGQCVKWIHRALVFLVVSCPCALVISVPLAYFGGLGGASRRGILIKGSSFCDTLTKCRTIVFDKTGTLTNGTFTVTELLPEGCTEDELLELAALAESYSSHPISQSIVSRCGEIDKSRVAEVSELAGRGVSAVVDGRRVLAGNMKLMVENGVAAHEAVRAGTVVYVAADGAYIGAIVISDAVKPGSRDAIDALQRRGICKTVMLTGDREAAAAAVASQLGIDIVYAGLLPEDKVRRVEELIMAENGGEKLAYVGDGINDAPVLARADVGIAMGALGSDAAIEAADVVLMDDDPRKIADAIDIARKTRSIAMQNIIFALAVKFAVLILSAFGLASMWAASFADVGVCVIAVMNSIRTLK